MPSFEPTQLSETTPGNIKAFGGSGSAEYLLGRPLARFPALPAVADFPFDLIAEFGVAVFVLRGQVDGYLVVECGVTELK